MAQTTLSLDPQKIVDYIVNNDMLDLGDVQNAMNKKEREELLHSHHHYRIWLENVYSRRNKASKQTTDCKIDSRDIGTISN